MASSFVTRSAFKRLVTIEARVVQGSSGARDSPEAAYPSDTNPDGPRKLTRSCSGKGQGTGQSKGKKES